MPVCPSCGDENPARARFCLSCGSPLAGPASTTRKERKFAAALFAGEVLVDIDRATGPRERMLTGDAVNTAARLQAAAEPPQVLVGAAIYAATKDVIDYRELSPLTLKGKEHPVPAWQAMRIKARRR